MKINEMEWIPVPYFKLNPNGEILRHSKEAMTFFTPANHFLDLVHLDDRLLARQLLVQTTSPPIRVSLKLIIHHDLYGLFACTVKWEGNIGHLVCTETTAEAMKVERQLKVEEQVLQTKQALIKSNNQLLKSMDQLIKTLESDAGK
ncbi:hypothetical protein IHQ11_22275 [Priestia megaterium]|uniref:hypothetical protein n=1 Tax=Priestia megaterium TaxID=1404 RepID=UPI001B3A6DBE|nr:hypothetical protein [Priestia megaterium]MBQ4869200.1 hypothetical protein [Priestia megaterium]MEB2277564.1 hypothetical protein [Bacillus sp. ILBB4]